MYIKLAIPIYKYSHNQHNYNVLCMNDEQLLLFRKILNIRNYCESTINNYNNSLIQFKNGTFVMSTSRRWRASEEADR